MNSRITESRSLQASNLDTVPPWRVLILDAVKRRIAWIGAEHRMSQALKELSALDDRLLADIGLRRSELAHAARRGRAHPPK